MQTTFINHTIIIFPNFSNKYYTTYFSNFLDFIKP
jgi:hypothetical protein